MPVLGSERHRDLIESGLARRRMTVLMEPVEESGRGKGGPVKVSTRFSLGLDNGGADAGRDGRS